MLIRSLSTQRYYRIAVSTFFFIQGLIYASWTSRIPDIKNLLHLNDAALGGILFSMPLGQLLAMLISGYTVGRFGSKTILSFVAILFPITLLFLGLVSSVWQLSIGLFIFGFFMNLSNISINTQAVGVERLYNRNIMASFHGVWSLAGFTGGLISSLMAGNHISPFHHFCIIFILAVISVIIAQKSILPRDGSKFEKTESKLFEKPDKLIVLLGLIAFADMFCEGTMFNWSSIYFERILKLPEELIRTGYIAFMLTMSSGRFMADKLATRFGITNIIKASGIIITTGLAISVIFPYMVTATFGFLLVGFGTSSIIPMCYSIAGKSKIMRPSMAVTTVSTIGFMGFLIGPPITGFISETLDLRWAFALSAFISLFIIILPQKLNNYIQNSQ